MFLQLDGKIRDWVLIPIVIVIFLFGVIREYVMAMLKPGKGNKAKGDETRHAQTLARGVKLRRNFHLIHSKSFQQRRSYFSHPENGVLQEEIKKNIMNSLTDPSNMTNMMKNNMANIVPNLAMFGLISTLFSGFVVAKFPFPLTSQFRSMIQRGIDLQSLDVSYVTSASMYFLVYFGMQGLQRLLLGDENAIDESKMMMQQQMGGMMGAMGGQQDFGKMFTAEKENMAVIKHRWDLEDEEKKLLKKKI